MDLDEVTTTFSEQSGPLRGTPPGGVHQRYSNDAKLRMPATLAVGAAYRPDDRWTISGDLTWRQWSRFNYNATSGNENPLRFVAGDKPHSPDTTTVRIGAEYLIIRDDYTVPLRCGLGYDPGPAIDEVDEYYTVSLGTGYQRGRVAFDIAYELRVGSDVNGFSTTVLSGSEDVLRHRIIASTIFYF